MYQTLQIQEVQAGLGPTTNACRIQNRKGLWTLGYIELYNGWYIPTFINLEFTELCIGLAGEPSGRTH